MSLPVRRHIFWKCVPTYHHEDAHTGCYAEYDGWDLTQLQDKAPPHFKAVCECPCHLDQAPLF